MVAKSLITDMLALPAADRLEIMERLWESLHNEPDALPLTDEQRQELDRRIQDMEENPLDESSWEEAEARLRSRK
jgi:putative addiction module component (TIGR02574 family)